MAVLEDMDALSRALPHGFLRFSTLVNLGLRLAQTRNRLDSEHYLVLRNTAYPLPGFARACCPRLGPGGAAFLLRITWERCCALCLQAFALLLGTVVLPIHLACGSLGTKRIGWRVALARFAIIRGQSLTTVTRRRYRFRVRYFPRISRSGIR